MEDMPCIKCTVDLQSVQHEKAGLVCLCGLKNKRVLSQKKTKNI